MRIYYVPTAITTPQFDGLRLIGKDITDAFHVRRKSIKYLS